ncbi:MAG: sigma-70 family RNA polymerase sigma factor [Oscillatoriales cyanobacterium]|nr:MAG: sigma-70 family RNA polymerase sigma factor [Oscillatoriales cyanobacterium]
MQAPVFSELNHPVVKSLFHHSDRELLTLFQNHPDQGRFFTAIFCRYAQIVHSLIRHSVRSPVQGDYLFAHTWNLSLQNWLINVTAVCINQAELPPVESIHYSLQSASPPLWCYVRQALELLAPLPRLVVLMAQTFRWSETRIAAYLQAEGEAISPAQVKALLQKGYQTLESNLPQDIRAIYLDENLDYQEALV